MPNWTSNEMEIAGPGEQVACFIAAVKGHMEDGAPIPLSFDSVIPSPQGADDDWRVANWGVKWDLDDHVEVEVEERWACYRFLTAWGAPDEAVQEMARKFPSLTFNLRYAEPGFLLAGYLEFVDGECVERHEVGGDRDEWFDLLDRYWPAEADAWRE